jgi:SNF2 family DNA or RNA helicase
MTGTVNDFWSQLEFLEEGASGFQSFDNFKSFYNNYAKDEGGFEKFLGNKNIPFLQERIAVRSFVISKKEAMPWLPDKVYDIVECEMSPDQKEAYENLRDSLTHQIESTLDDETQNRSVVINNALTQLLRLAQITSGFIRYDAIAGDDGTVIQPAYDAFFDPNPKVQTLIELLKEKGPDDKTIIWAHWVNDQELTLQKALLEANIDYVLYRGNEHELKEAERRFNFDVKCKVFLGSAGKGGTGLNLLGYPPGAGDDYTTNCNHTIYFSQDWSGPKRWQSEDRAHRRGTREPHRITDLVIPGTIDEEIRARVLQKKTLALTVSDVRQILHNVLRGVIE